MSHPDFDEVRDITVIGAGPVGLSAAFWAGMREASSRIIDSLPELGGQLTTLYPEKWIFDVPGHPKILAKDLVELHRAADARAVRRARAPRDDGRVDLLGGRPRRPAHRQGRPALAHGDRGRRPRRLRAQEAARLRHDRLGGPRRALPRRLQERVRGQARGHHRRRRQRLRLGRQPARHRRARRARAPPRGLPRPRGDGQGGHGRPRRGAHRPARALPGARRRGQRHRRGRAALPLRGQRQGRRRRRATRSCSSSASRPRSGR